MLTGFKTSVLWILSLTLYQLSHPVTSCKLKKKLSHTLTVTSGTPYLQEDDEVLRLVVLHDELPQVLQGGHTNVDLVVRAHHHDQAEIVHDVRPVQVVPEALLQPVDADLDTTTKQYLLQAVVVRPTSPRKLQPVNTDLNMTIKQATAHCLSKSR